MATSDLVPLTVFPGEDVLVPLRTTVAQARARLAELLCRPELRTAALFVGDRQTADADVIGERSLLAGSILAVEHCRPAPAPPEPLAAGFLDAEVLVHRISGMETGYFWSVPPRRTPREDTAAGERRSRLFRRARRLIVPGLGHVWTTKRGRVRVRRSRQLRAKTWRIGRTISGTCKARSTKATGCEPTATAYQIMRGPGAGQALADYWEAVATRSPEPAAARKEAQVKAAADLSMGALWPALASACAGLGIALFMQQTTFALFSLVGLLSVAPQVAVGAKRRRAKRVGLNPGSGRRSPRRGAENGRGRTGVSGTAPSVCPDPCGLAIAALAAREISSAGWRSAVAACAQWRTNLGADALAALVPDGAVAFVGSPELARAAARALVAELLASGATAQVVGANRADWSWLRWQPNPPGSPSGNSVYGTVCGTPLIAGSTAVPKGLPAVAPPVLIVDSLGTNGDHVDLSASGPIARAMRNGTFVVLVGSGAARVPTWCRDVRTVDHHSIGVSEEWARWLACTLTAARQLGRDLATGPGRASANMGEGSFGLRGGVPDEEMEPNSPSLPTTVPLAALLPLRPAWASSTAVVQDDLTVRHKARTGTSWWVPLGLGTASAPVGLDLVKDGPHLLVAGTTGAGKSELLQALILALALTHSPAELSLALIDFKGGASFGACAQLPHVVGQVSDLDVGLAQRALTGLRAELRRRKQVLAVAGVADIEDLPSAASLPRLVVVFDEFRALAEDLPDLIPGLLRVAAQGRSLGLHLVLATQRPAGAVSAEVRANVSARIALRMVDPSDSNDVIDSPIAAEIFPGQPGRAVLRVGAERPIVFQGAYAPLPTTSPQVRRMPPWLEVGDELDRGPSPGPGSASETSPNGDTDLFGVTVALLRKQANGFPQGRAPWQPPLPDFVQKPEMSSAPSGTTSELPFALGDYPDEQRQGPISWDVATGHLAVLGRARSGRSTVLRALAVAALNRGWQVHVVSDAPDVFADLDGHPGFGTLVGIDDVRRCHRLLTLLSQRPPDESKVRVLLCLDPLDVIQQRLLDADSSALAGVLRADGLAVVASAANPAIAGQAAAFGPRLVLLSNDATEDSLLGVPRDWAGRGKVPGRALWQGSGEPVECQVYVADGPNAEAAVSATRGEPLRLMPLPRRVELAALGTSASIDMLGSPCAIDRFAEADQDGRLLVPIGIGGDHAEPLSLDLTDGALIVGPRGSGRSNTLGAICAGLARSGRASQANVVTADRRLADLAGNCGVSVFATLESALDGTPAAANDRRDSADRAAQSSSVRQLLLVDDLDVVEQLRPIAADNLAQAMLDGQVTLVAATTTMAAVLAHRGPTATLRAARTGIVLHPDERGSNEVFAFRFDPGEVPLPGRGQLVQNGRAEPVQVAVDE